MITPASKSQSISNYGIFIKIKHAFGEDCSHQRAGWRRAARLFDLSKVIRLETEEEPEGFFDMLRVIRPET
jgi:hypothetical protein